ncbi:MAG: hypothetical protein P8J63_01545 [Verrucomicrobiota bacterium]|nr:hypothetical protein [Verrucomicrobiota bacterium]
MIIVGAGFGRGRAIGSKHRRAGGIAYAKLELPFLGPILLLLVLAELDEQRITALGEVDL